jgi:hypothetical protein
MMINEFFKNNWNEPSPIFKICNTDHKAKSERKMQIQKKITIL